jgi:4-amino-4-deoxy-L-arabinose transferase-like glycosyltransferase
VGALVPLLLYLVGKRLFDPLVAVLAAAWAAIYPHFIYYSAALMTESFFAVGVLLILYLLLVFRERPTLANAVFLGAAIGATTLLRQTFLPVLPWLFLWLVWAMWPRIPWRGLLAVAIASAVFIAPWTIRNYRVYDSFLLLNSNASYAFWSANHPSQGSRWIPNLETVVVPIPPEWQNLNEAQLDKALLRDAARFIAEDPARYLSLTLSKAPEQFMFWPTSGSPLISNLTRTLSFGLALPFMLAGVYLSRHAWRKLIPVYLLVVSYNASFLLSWPSARYRLATDTVMLLFAALPLAVGLRYLQRARMHGKPE